MVIKTKAFAFPRIVYMGILIHDLLQSSWWAGVFLVGIAVYQSTQKNSFGLLWSLFPAAYLGYIFIRCWIQANAKKNLLFFAERQFEIDDKIICCRFSQGTINRIVVNDIARVVKNRRFYRLFLNKRQFVYLPINVFKTPGDMSRFDEILRARKRKNIPTAGDIPQK